MCSLSLLTSLSSKSQPAISNFSHAGGILLVYSDVLPWGSVVIRLLSHTGLPDSRLTHELKSPRIMWRCFDHCRHGDATLGSIFIYTVNSYCVYTNRMFAVSMHSRTKLPLIGQNIFTVMEWAHRGVFHECLLIWSNTAFCGIHLTFMTKTTACESQCIIDLFDYVWHYVNWQYTNTIPQEELLNMNIMFILNNTNTKYVKRAKYPITTRPYIY